METAEPLAASRASTLDPTVSVLSIADKLSDREQWKRNLILYIVPETTNDKGFFTDLYKTVYNLNIVTTNARCSALVKRKKKEQPQHRPLLLVLEKK